MRAKPGLPANHPLPTADTLAKVTDALAWPLLLLRADTTLLHANHAARVLLRRGRPLAVTAQREVRPADTHHQRAYEQALQLALADAPPPLLRWPASRASAAYCALVRALPEADGAQPALLLTLCPDTGTDSELLALLMLRPPLAPAGRDGEGE